MGPRPGPKETGCAQCDIALRGCITPRGQKYHAVAEIPHVESVCHPKNETSKWSIQRERQSGAQSLIWINVNEGNYKLSWSQESDLIRTLGVLKYLKDSAGLCSTHILAAHQGLCYLQKLHDYLTFKLFFMMQLYFQQISQLTLKDKNVRTLYLLYPCVF